MQKTGRIINRFLGIFGLYVRRTRSNTLSSLEFDFVFSRLRSRNIPLSTVIDIGASNGCWSEELIRFFPNAYYHLIEANAVHEPGLEKFKSRHINSSYILAAAADFSGQIYFDATDSFGGLAGHHATGDVVTKVACTTVDDEVSANNLRGPFLIKLDTHGFEVPILEGAKSALAQTNVLVVETYNFHLTNESLTFWEMCDHLFKIGFRPAGLLEPVHRPKDGVFWQVDILFLRSDRSEFSDNSYD